MFALQQLSDIAPYTMTIMYHGWQSVCRQGGYNTGKSGSWAIAFPHALLGMSGDYYSDYPGDTEWGPTISGNTTNWSTRGTSNVRVIAIGY